MSSSAMVLPTLIIRLLGLYLLLSGSEALWQLHGQTHGQLGGALGQLPQVMNFKSILIARVLVGITATAFAGRLARLFTFDAGSAEPR